MVYQLDRARTAGRTAILAVAVLLMAALGSLYAWSVLVAPLERELEADRAAVSGVFSVAIAAFTLAMLAAGGMQRCLRAPPLAALAGLLGCVGVGASAVVPSLPVAVLGLGVAFGAANGIGYALAIALAQATFPRRRGLATGLVVAAYTLGAALAAPLLAGAEAVFGLRATLLAWAGGLLLVGVSSAAALARARAELPAAEARCRDDARSPPHPGVFAALWSGFLLASLVGVMVIGHAASILAWAGAEADATALAAVVVALANGVGRLGGGWLTDRVPAHRFLAGGMAAAAAALLLLWCWPSPSLALAAILAVGIAYGAVAGAYPAVVADLYGPREAPRAYGRVFTSWGLAGLAGPYAAGLLFDRTGGYGAACLAGAACAALAAVACAAIPRAASSRAGLPSQG